MEEKKARLKNRPNVIISLMKIILGLNWPTFRESSGISGDMLPQHHDRSFSVSRGI
jgi:hypothetical protein